MQRLKNGLLASALITSIFNLTGCGEGSTGTHGALIAPPPETKTIISIGNETKQTFVRAILLDQNGNPLKTQEIDCKPAATGCMMFLPSDVQQTATLIVQDKQGQMIGAFRFPNKLQPYNAAYPNSLTTGIYLTHRLVRDYLLKDGVSWPEARQKLEVFFQNYDSPDGSADLFEEMGDYYSKRMASTPTTENEFLETLKKRLMNGEVAKLEELPTKSKKHTNLDFGNKIVNAYTQLRTANISLISAAYAQEPSEGCPSAVQTYLSWVNNMAGSIPVVGDAVAGAAGFAGELCQPDTNAKLDKMLSKLDALQTSVNQIANSLGVLKDFTEDAAINSETQTFQNIEKSARKDVTRYMTFLTMHRVKSLEEYIKDWDANTKDNPELIEILRAPNTTLVSMKDLTKNANFNTYSTALNNRCKTLQQNRPGVNFVNVRQGCNNNIVYNTALLAGTQQLLSPMLTDIYKVLAKFNNDPNVGPNKVFNKIGTPTGIVTDYSQATAQIKNFYNNELGALVKKLQTDVGHDQKGFFNLYEGLNTALQANLVAKDCISFVVERKNFPAITGWYSPTNDSKDNYIVTECKMESHGYSKGPIKARYFYENQGSGVDPNNVANVLGVPVAMHYVKSLKAANNMRDHQDKLNTGTWVIEAPYINAFNNEPDFGNKNGIISNSWATLRDHVLQKKPDQPGYYQIKIPGDSSDGDWYTWVSLKDKQGFHYVTLLQTYVISGGWGAYGVGLFLNCVTSDCSRYSEWLRFTRPGEDHYVVDLSKRPSGRIQLGPLQ